MTWLVILAMYHKIFQHMIFQNIAFFIVRKLLKASRCRVRSTCARCNCHYELTKTRNSETQWRGSPCRFDQRMNCCSVFWKYCSWSGKTGVRLLYKRWTPSHLESALQFVLRKQKHGHQSWGDPKTDCEFERNDTQVEFFCGSTEADENYRMRTFPNTTRRKMKRNTQGLVLQNVLT